MCTNIILTPQYTVLKTRTLVYNKCLFNPWPKVCANLIAVTRIFLCWPKVYLTVINNRTPLSIRNNPISDPITKLGIVHTFRQSFKLIKNNRAAPLPFITKNIKVQGDCKLLNIESFFLMTSFLHMYVY